jgi:hypothetical protein
MGGFNGTLHLEMEDFDKGTTPSLPVPSKSLEESFTIHQKTDRIGMVDET